MGKNTTIEWADHTFNPWLGCTKVSPGCEHCYAEAWARRYGIVEWGPHPRRSTSDANWEQPRKWNRAAEKYGVRPRVFCASLADVFDPAAPPEWRADLWRLIDETLALDWILVTKRVANVPRMVPSEWMTGAWPARAWLLATICNQVEADRNIPRLLLGIPAAIRGLSCEPLLGPVNLGADAGLLSWVICGGESGPGARPMHPDWALNLRDQCVASGVRFFFKQWGEWAPSRAITTLGVYTGGGVFLDGTGRKVGHGEWREGHAAAVDRVGKLVAGRYLDGRTWDQVPGGAA